MTAAVETGRSTRPESSEHVPYYATYIARVPNGDIVRQLTTQIADTNALLGSLSESQAAHRYAEGKWSIREVVGHLCDTERVFTYRAMRFARSDSTPVPGFDENHYVAHGRFDSRTLSNLAGEFRAVRAATIAFFDGLTNDDWPLRGVANGNGITVRALAWIAAGHELHHVHILRTRYLNLA
jgi:uncharacterized damage-inducible protein DinB